MNEDLKKRIPTAILYVLAIAVCTLGGTLSSIFLIVSFWFLCQFEFVMHSKGKNWRHQVIPGIMSILFLVVVLTEMLNENWWPWIILAVLLFQLINLFHLLSRANSLLRKLPFLFSLTWYLVLPFLIVVQMLQADFQAQYMLLGLFVLIWLNDAGAYFAGKAFGKNKLLPEVSPSKTWEGFFGGGILTVLGAIALHFASGLYDLEVWLLLAVPVFLFSVVGDLTESAWKRNLGIKDTGTYLPGHGGFLDRLDSFIYTAPVLAMAVKILGS